MTNNDSPHLISIGIDPGTKNGAIAIIDDELNIIYLAKTPYISVDIKSKKVKPKLNKETGKYETAYKQRTWVDFRNLREIFLPFLDNDIIFTTEKVKSMGEDEHTSSAFNFGHTLGVFQGQYSLLNPIAFYEPTPQVWKKEMKVTADKNSSIELAEELFKCNLKDYLPKRARVKDDNMAEALLLAFYGLRMYFSKEDINNGSN